MTIEQAKYELLSLAMEQIGYREGPNNWNKYAAEPAMTQLLGWNAQNQPWCNIFVNACFVACFGMEIGAAMLYQPIGGGSALCRASADFFKAACAWIERGRTPEPGDVIFFYRSGDINHMGIVSSVAGGSVVTVEGNSSDSVAERCYSVNDTSIAGYGRPQWALAAIEEYGKPDSTAGAPEPAEPAVGATGAESADSTAEEPKTPDFGANVQETEKHARYYTLIFPYVQIGSTGEAVTAVQIALLGRGYGIGPDGADGEYGGNTESAVRRFQASIGLMADGIVGPNTGAALFGGEVYTAPATQKPEPKADSFWNNLLTKIRK